MSFCCLKLSQAFLYLIKTPFSNLWKEPFIFWFLSIPPSFPTALLDSVYFSPTLESSDISSYHCSYLLIVGHFLSFRFQLKCHLPRKFVPMSNLEQTMSHSHQSVLNLCIVLPLKSYLLSFSVPLLESNFLRARDLSVS